MRLDTVGVGTASAAPLPTLRDRGDVDGQENQIESESQTRRETHAGQGQGAAAEEGEEKCTSEGCHCGCLYRAQHCQGCHAVEEVKQWRESRQRPAEALHQALGPGWKGAR